MIVYKVVNLGAVYRVVLEGVGNYYTHQIVPVAEGAVAARMFIDTDSLRVVRIIDCDGVGGTRPRDPGTDWEQPPTSVIIDFEEQP